jgi:hypothetical protein
MLGNRMEKTRVKLRSHSDGEKLASKANDLKSDGIRLLAGVYPRPVKLQGAPII